MLFEVRRHPQSIICFSQHACKQGGGSVDKSSRKNGGRLGEQAKKRCNFIHLFLIKLNRYVYACASHTISVFYEGFVVDPCSCLAKIVVCSSLTG
jgi:hypothetical protein